MRTEIRALVERIEPFDELEVVHRDDALEWIASDAEIFRVEKPATPPKHLISYFVLVDERAGAVLLIDHVISGHWLPPGGHVEVDEHPVETVRREAEEELGIDAVFLYETSPLFVTQTLTVGDDPHVDVSLWFVLTGAVDMTLAPDPAEMRSVRWWHYEELAAADPADFDPHMGRFAAKLKKL